jgi:hypothetical protein
MCVATRSIVLWVFHIQLTSKVCMYVWMYIYTYATQFLSRVYAHTTCVCTATQGKKVCCVYCNVYICILCLQAWRTGSYCHLGVLLVTFRRQTNMIVKIWCKLVYACICMCLYMCVCECMCMCVCMYLRMHAYMYMYIYVCICIPTYTEHRQLPWFWRPPHHVLTANHCCTRSNNVNMDVRRRAYTCTWVLQLQNTCI